MSSFKTFWLGPRIMKCQLVENIKQLRYKTTIPAERCKADSPHGHIASIYNHWSEASSWLSVWPWSGLAGTGAASSGHQFGTVWDSVAGFYQLLQDVIGLGVVMEALQHPQNITVRVSQLEETLHFSVLLLVVHGRLRFRMWGLRVLPLLCLLRTVRLGNPPRLLILVHQCHHGNSLCFGTVDRCQKMMEATSVTHCKHRKPAAISQGFSDKSIVV